MNWPTIDEALHELNQRGILCGMATMVGGRVRAWVEVDGVLVEGLDFDPTQNERVSDQVAFWLKEMADRIYVPLSDLVDGVLPDNVVDARSRFLRGRKTLPTNEAFTS